MELSFCLNYLLKRRGTAQPRDIAAAAALCRDAGFAYLDYSPNYTAEDWEARAHRDREILDRAGLKVEQTHAPMNRYRQYDPTLFPTYYDNLFRASEIVGAKYVVVHADEYRTTDHYDEQEIQDYAYDYLAPRVEFAEKHGMAVAIENLFEDRVPHCPQIGGKSRFTSRVGELKGLIERFNTPSVGLCWDFGHAKCAFGNEGMLDALRQVSRYLLCTHVHDNYYGRDLHLMPFLGDIDWEAHMAHLKEIGYAGKLSFELVYGSLPDPLLPIGLQTLRAVGEYMIGL